MKGKTYPRRGLHGEFVHDLGLRILRGELRPGDSLPMDEDPHGDLNVSRTVVREAVKVLAAKGLVEARPKTGTQVRSRVYWNLMDPDVLAWRLEADPDDGFFLDVSELRRVIEPAVAALAARRASPEEVVELERAFAEMEASAPEYGETYIAADVRFHEIILEGCHNELLAHLGSTLRAVFRASFTRTRNLADERTLALHRAVALAIGAGDSGAAEAAMMELIEVSAAYIAESEPEGVKNSRSRSSRRRS
jgi:GntR family galactonate operon transcriptional repressor